MICHNEAIKTKFQNKVSQSRVSSSRSYDKYSSYSTSCSVHIRVHNVSAHSTRIFRWRKWHRNFQVKLQLHKVIATTTGNAEFPSDRKTWRKMRSTRKAAFCRTRVRTFAAYFLESCEKAPSHSCSTQFGIKRKVATEETFLETESRSISLEHTRKFVLSNCVVRIDSNNGLPIGFCCQFSRFSEPLIANQTNRSIEMVAGFSSTEPTPTKGNQRLKVLVALEVLVLAVLVLLLLVCECWLPLWEVRSRESRSLSRSLIRE